MGEEGGHGPDVLQRKDAGDQLSEADLGKIKPGVSKSPVGWFEAIRTEKPYPIKAIIWAGNPYVLWPGLSRLKDALKNVEVIAHLEIWKNDTSLVSDYVFPSAHGVEYGEINRSTEDRRALWIQKMIDPPGMPDRTCISGSNWGNDSGFRRF